MDSDDRTNTYRTSLNESGFDSVSNAVVAGLATIQDVNPSEVEPLYEAVDPDALDDLFPADPQDQASRSVTFTLDGYEVTVSAEGDLVFRNLTPEGSGPDS